MSSQFKIAGKQVHCPHCDGVEFEAKDVLMNTRGASFMNLDWLNQSAVALTCAHCGHIAWFNVKPEAIE